MFRARGTRIIVDGNDQSPAPSYGRSPAMAVLPEATAANAAKDFAAAVPLPPRDLDVTEHDVNGIKLPAHVSWAEVKAPSAADLSEAADLARIYGIEPAMPELPPDFALMARKAVAGDLTAIALMREIGARVPVDMRVQFAEMVESLIDATDG